MSPIIIAIQNISWMFILAATNLTLVILMLAVALNVKNFRYVIFHRSQCLWR